MLQSFNTWLQALQAMRERWVTASRENNFDRGIWNATVEKYADPSHFIFELLQNAEDARATWVRFTLEPDRILFEHDGRAFDRDDIGGITGIGNTTKLDDGHKIGCFGIGFKSVYVVTERPEVHSRIDGQSLAFAIEDLVIPKLIPTDFDDSTTRIILPFRIDRAEITLARARLGLATAGPRALLFLEHVKLLEWVDQGSTGSARVDDLPIAIRSIQSRLPHQQEKQERFLVLTRGVERDADHKQYGVKIALRLNDDGELIPEDAATRLRVFFETEETTGLHFLIHGPFQLTDNRANIKRDDSWNAKLIDTIADLLTDTLPDLRERGLLKRGVLDLLPNAADELPPVFAPILKKVVAKFAQEALIPVHGGGYATVGTSIRGPADLRELLGDDGLQLFAGKPDRRWIVSGLRNSRSESLLTTLKIEEWSYGEFLAAFQHAFATHYHQSENDAQKLALAWFNDLSDETMQRFLLALDTAMKAQKRTVSLANYQFIRLEDGRRHSPNAAVFAPADTALDPEAENCGLYLVKSSLVRTGRGRGRDVEQFLRRIGVKDVDERAYLAAIIRTHYKGDGSRPNRERHLQHMRRFIRWSTEHGDTRIFAGLHFVRAGVDASYHSAADVYLGSPYLESALTKVYDGSVQGREKLPLWDGYQKLRRKELIDFLAACGMETRLCVTTSTIRYDHPQWYELRRGFGSSRATGTGVDSDHHIEQLADLLKRSDPEISRLIWDAVRTAGAGSMAARYSPNQTKAAKQAPSSLAILLRAAAWIPARDGTLRQPRTMVTGDLTTGFTIGGNEGWLQAIGFADDHRLKSEQHKERRKAGELIGLAPELVDQLQGLPANVLAALNAEIIRKLSSHAYEPVAFPERETRDPGRRAERLAARAQAAPSKSYEVRPRSVRVSDAESKGVTRTYLEDHYSNHLGDMVCQACHDVMPFKLPNGTHYFEACELLESLTTEHAENHLALCPTCAAKWRYANPAEDLDLRASIAAATSPEIEVELAGEPVRLRFTQVHLDDIRTIVGMKKT
ncbi:hypothetical protein ELH72_30150 (plasmid) [Rhizobium ruizarguesonis]|uniref:sacsin N-terminal ATP-binding-like domain-containing protein n=1 Tax=Rhizobium ruizarguesonis TaxID=2081791 RepID=UPI00102FE428|nr:hypothetical protein [Rhizobium ruizarguesonis]TAZ70703.1 hypothetical protein ELH72_30150 [Rhizobium ruizarguesonis]